MGGRRWEKEQRGTHSPQNPLGMEDVERRCQIRVSTDQLQTAEPNLAPKQGQLMAEDSPMSLGSWWALSPLWTS